MIRLTRSIRSCLRTHQTNSLLVWVSILTGAGVLGGGGCTRSDRPLGNHLVLQMAGEPASLDPSLAEDGASLKVLCNTMEGLVGYDGDGKLSSWMAESYKVSADGRRYDFTLRHEAHWSDGKSVTAEDFVTAFRRALAPDTGAKLAGTLFPILGARELYEGRGKPESLGAREEGGHLVIELREPAPYFIQALTMPVALPLRADILAANHGKWPDTAPGNGPYHVVAHATDRRILFEKNPGYWTPTTDFPDVEMTVVDDESAGLNLFEQGKLDVLSKITPALLPKLREKGVIHTSPFLATYYLSFNFKKPPFSDVLWRQAVAGAIRRDQIVEALGSGDMPARSWVPPRLEGFIPYSDPAPEFGRAMAQVKKSISSHSETLDAVFDTSARNQQIMEQVQEDLKRTLGLKIRLSNLDWKTFLKSAHTDPAPIFRLGILSPFMDPIQILEAFTTGNPNNYLKWSNAEYDRLVQRVAVLAPGAERERKIREAQAILVDREAIVVPIYHYVQNHAVGPRVVGFKANPFGEVRFSELRVKKEGTP